MSQKVINKKSHNLVNGAPKLPNTEDIDFGEIAINYATNHETIAIKNESGEIATFSSDNVYPHLPNVTSANNDNVLTVVNGQWSGKTPVFIYYGGSQPESGTGQNGDIYAQLGFPGEVVYYNSVSGVLTSSTYNVTFDYALDDFDYVLCYFRASKHNVSDTMAIPPAVVRISLDSDSAIQSGEYCGSVSIPYINNKNRYAAYSCIINSSKTQFKISYQQSLYGTGTTDVSDDTHGVYCYKIVAFKDNAVNNLIA